MDIEYESLIDFSPVKRILDERGLKVKWLADKVGQLPNRVSQIMKNNTFPKTDLVAKIAFTLNLPVSEIVVFNGIGDKLEKALAGYVLPYSPENASGEVTYEPLRTTVQMYLDYLYDQTGKEKTVNELYDLIEPYRRRNNIPTGGGKEVARKSVEKRFGEGYKSERTGRTYNAKGLTPSTRTKIKNDRPLNIRTIYDICKFFGCSIDRVMSYK